MLVFPISSQPGECNPATAPGSRERAARKQLRDAVNPESQFTLVQRPNAKSSARHGKTLRRQPLKISVDVLPTLAPAAACTCRPGDGTPAKQDQSEFSQAAPSLHSAIYHQRQGIHREGTTPAHKPLSSAGPARLRVCIDRRIHRHTSDSVDHSYQLLPFAQKPPDLRGSFHHHLW